MAGDCARGNGQAAVGVAADFTLVLATDASAPQLSVTESHPHIADGVATTDHSGLCHQSADLVIVAQDQHGFEAEPFDREEQRM